jgi:3-deoxy-D-manno-octulosonic acid (KDO) 8-phosphate synthase
VSDVRTVVTVYDTYGTPVTVGVDHGCVTVDGKPLEGPARRQFVQGMARALTLAQAYQETHRDDGEGETP